MPCIFCGFRLFGTKDQAETFFNTVKSPDKKFQSGWKGATGTPPMNLTSGKIIEELRKKPRVVKGRPATYETKPVAATLYKLATGRALEAKPDSDDQAGRALLAFETQLKKAFSRKG